MSASGKKDSKRAKIDKPLAERKRRARINDALLQLKNMVLQSVDKKGSFMSKLEKADILEMTIEYINQIKQCNTQGDIGGDSTYTIGFNECNAYVIDYLNNGGTSGTSDSGLRARLMKHLSNVSNSTDSNDAGLQIVGIIAPKTEQVDVLCKGNEPSKPTRIIVPKVGDQRPELSYVLEQLDGIESTRTANMQEDVEAIANQTSLQSNNSNTNVKISTLPKKRKVLGDISNNSLAYSANCRSRKGQHIERNVGAQILKPLKKRITEQMLQSSVDNTQPDPCDINRTVDFMANMTTLNNQCQSSERSHSADTSSTRLIGFQRDIQDTCQFDMAGMASKTDALAFHYSERHDHSSTTPVGQENTSVLYNIQSSVPEQACNDEAKMYDYQIYSQGPLESSVWRPW